MHPIDTRSNAASRLLALHGAANDKTTSNNSKDTLGHHLLRLAVAVASGWLGIPQELKRGNLRSD